MTEEKEKIPHIPGPEPAHAANIEDLIHRYAVRMADEWPKIASSSQSEEDVRHDCNKIIDEFLDQGDIKVKGRHEYGLAGGRIDSKYGGVIIEYKAPGVISTETGRKAVIRQIQGRFSDLQAQDNVHPDQIFGVGCDGATIVFVRHRGENFEVDSPRPVRIHTAERLLRALVSLGARGYSFTPDQLAVRFGAESDLTQKSIKAIYNAIADAEDEKAKTFFNQWKILFGEVCGYDVEGKNEKVKKLGDHYNVRGAKSAELLFAVHTYYAVFMKLMAAEVVSSLSPLRVSPLKKCIDAPTPEKLREVMEELEQGGIWSHIGVTNFLEGDLFSWYLAAWNKNIAEAIRGVVSALDEFDPNTLSVDPFESRDLLKKLYQQLFPRSVRHDLGEYYTPDWLAEYVLDEVGYDGNPDRRVLDPGCGSGTFLVLAINRVKAWFDERRHECGYRADELLKKILTNIIGFDLNPLAVMAARTNYLIALRDLWLHSRGMELPIYLCDSIMTPAEYGKDFFESMNTVKELKTSAGSFFIPKAISRSREHMGKYAELLERCIRDKFTADDFIARCEAEGLPVEPKSQHRELYEKLRKLDAKNQNGIWARIIKNAFAPLFVGHVDYVVGNPPWVNWESLPGNYRDDMKPLWERYGLFTLSGSAGRLGGGKKDLSMLFVYGGVDNYLNEGGKLGFVITQTIFKTHGAGDGFRRFRYGNKQTVIIRPRIVHDLSDMQVFEAATNRTSIFVCEKSSKDFSYPVPYVVWRGPSRIDPSEKLSGVRARARRKKLAAIPVDPEKITSPWLTAPTPALPGIKKVIGKSDYKAYEGVNTGGLNGAYWIRILEKLKNGNLLIENLHDVGKIKVEQVQAAIEPDLVYPLLRGRDVSRWHAEPSVHIILAQDPEKGKGIAPTQMKRKYPKTYGYLRQFEGSVKNPDRGTLRGRALFKKYFDRSDPFYSMYNVGPYTLAPWKVYWTRVATKITAAVAGSNRPTRPLLSIETATFVPFETPREAHYFAALLNSAPCRGVIESYSSKGTGSFGSPHILTHVSIPKFSATDKAHIRLAELSMQCHTAAAKGDMKKVAALEAKIDKAAAELWGITDKELKAIQKALKETERPRLSRKTEGRVSEEEASYGTEEPEDDAAHL
jgi:SAM-dependent methyltransferase